MPNITRANYPPSGTTIRDTAGQPVGYIGERELFSPPSRLDGYKPRHEGMDNLTIDQAWDNLCGLFAFTLHVTASSAPAASSSAPAAGDAKADILMQQAINERTTEFNGIKAELTTIEGNVSEFEKFNGIMSRL